MKWLSLLVSFIIGKLNSAPPISLKETALIVLEEVAYRSRKPVALLLGSLVCVLILCGGFFMGLIDVANQLDRTGGVYFSANLIAGLVLVAVSAALFFWIFNSAWPGAQDKKVFSEATSAPAMPSSLEQALSLLVMDFIKEREYKRDHRGAPPAENEAPPLYNN